jgi:Mg2+/Co2+ transporter CorB
MTTKESEGYNHVNNSGTSQYTKRGTTWAAVWFFQNFKCNRRHSAATISDYGSTGPAISNVILQIIILMIRASSKRNTVSQTIEKLAAAINFVIRIQIYVMIAYLCSLLLTKVIFLLPQWWKLQSGS